MRQSGREMGEGRGGGEKRRAGVREIEAKDSFPTTRASLPPSPTYSRGLFFPLCPSFAHSLLSLSLFLPPPRVASLSHPQPTLTRNKSIHVSADYLVECSRPCWKPSAEIREAEGATIRRKNRPSAIVPPLPSSHCRARGMREGGGTASPFLSRFFFYLPGKE